MANNEPIPGEVIIDFYDSETVKDGPCSTAVVVGNAAAGLTIRSLTDKHSKRNRLKHARRRAIVAVRCMSRNSIPHITAPKPHKHMSTYVKSIHERSIRALKFFMSARMAKRITPWKILL